MLLSKDTWNRRYIAEVATIERGVMLILEFVSVDGRPLDKLDVTSLNFSGVVSKLKEAEVSVRIA